MVIFFFTLFTCSVSP